jgi:hypothetical protein
MNIKEINEQKWKVSPNLKVDYNALAGLSMEEQELHLNVWREGDSKKEIVRVCCSHTTQINDLARSEYFELQEVLLSSHERTKDTIMEIKGILPSNALTIRKKIPIVSDELRKQRSERAKKNFGFN